MPPSLFTHGIVTDLALCPHTKEDELAIFLLFDWTAWQKRNHLRRILAHRKKRRHVEDQLVVLFDKVLKWSQETTALVEDPFLLDRIVADLQDTASYLKPNQWPAFTRFLEEFEGLADASRPTRLPFLLAAMRPHLGPPC